MVSINYPFTTPSNYIYDSDKIEVIGGVAQLKLVVAGGQVFNEDFADDTGFVYDNTKAEFVAGSIRQKDVTPINSLFAVGYTTDFNLFWHKAGGSLLGTLNGVPTLVAGKLVCTGTQGVYYQRNSSVVETHKFKHIPNYTTSPPANVNIVSTWNGSNNDRFLLSHSPAGNTLRITLENNIGGSVIAVATVIGAAWTPTASQEYEFEVVIDSVLGTIRVFIDGVLHGTLSPGAWTRGIGVMRYYIGACPSIYDRAEGSFDDYIMFSNAQHIAGYTPGYTIDLTLYVESEIELPVFTHVGLGTIISVDGMTSTEAGSPRYSFESGSLGHVYWNGLSWVTSDGSYAQANDVATANTNLPTLNVFGEITFHVHMHFIDSNTQSSVDDLTVQHTANTIFDITNPTIKPTTSVNQDAILSFIAILTAVGLDDVRFALQVDGQDIYWDGAAWSNADGTYVQTNDLVTVQTNIATFNERGGLIPIVHLHSNDGSTTPNIDDIIISFDFFGGIAVVENVCTVWGYLYDELNTPIFGTTISVTPTSFGITNNKLINRNTRQVTTDVDGYWEIKLIETETSSNNFGYKFEMPGYVSSRYVPNTVAARFNDLVSIS